MKGFTYLIGNLDKVQTQSDSDGARCTLINHGRGGPPRGRALDAGARRAARG